MLVFVRTRPKFEELKTRVLEEIPVNSQEDLLKALSTLLSWLNKYFAWRRHLAGAVFKKKGVCVFVLNLQCFVFWCGIACGIQVLWKCKISAHFLPHPVHYRRWFESLRTGKVVCLFTKRAVYGHHEHPARWMFAVRSSLDKEISGRYWKEK